MNDEPAVDATLICSTPPPYRGRLPYRCSTCGVVPEGGVSEGVRPDAPVAYQPCGHIVAREA